MISDRERVLQREKELEEGESLNGGGEREGEDVEEEHGAEKGNLLTCSVYEFLQY